MAWRRTGDKPLSEPMIAYLGDAYMPFYISYYIKMINDSYIPHQTYDT